LHHFETLLDRPLYQGIEQKKTYLCPYHKRGVIKKIPIPRLTILKRCYKNYAKAKDISKNEGS